MEVLKLETEFYTLSVQTNNPMRSWKRFESRLADKARTYCDYASSVAGKLILSDFLSEAATLTDDTESLKWVKKHPVFFETNTYNFALRFTGIKGRPSIMHPNKAVADLFSWFPANNSGGILTGSINFLNEPGRFTLSFTYETPDQKNRTDHFSFDVVSPKLDTKEDYKSIVETINREYNELVYKYLTLTFQQLERKGRTNNELIWLSVFQEVIEGYLRACNYIVNKPHSKMKEEVYYQRPDRIKRWTPRMEERFGEKQAALGNDVSNAYFRNELTDTTIDTRENQFVKFTLGQIGKKLHNVIRKVETGYGDSLSDEYRANLTGYAQQLDKLIRNKMFRTIGEFEGFRQESMVLQKRTGYAQVYRYWLMLQSGLSMFDGTTNIGMKQIWELYELWCFLKMKEMIGSLEFIKQCDETKESKETMLRPFSDTQMEHCVTFINTGNNDIVELKYQHTYNRNNSETHTATTEQRPDIVLNIKKADSDFVLTYLYDAKYRVMDDLRGSADDITDEPVPDAINQMHRYRDAIYYGQNKHYAAKEIIGGYVLFPGRGDDEHVRNKYYFKSIGNINIGAFPLLPDNDRDKEGRLLKEHLKNIILEKTEYQQIADAVPQKGLVYENEQDTNVFVGVVKPDNKDYRRFIDGNADLYYTGRKFPSTFNILSFKFFAPYYDGGIREYYEIVGIRSALKSEIEKLEDDSNDGIRFFFELGKCVKLPGSPVKIQLINDTYQSVPFKDMTKISS